MLSLLERLDINKAQGVDGVSARLLRTGPGISRSLTVLFNNSLRCGQIPQEWKSAKVTPIQKISEGRMCEGM